jgi:hypothetical protein
VTYYDTGANFCNKVLLQATVKGSDKNLSLPMEPEWLDDAIDQEVHQHKARP